MKVVGVIIVNIKFQHKPFSVYTNCLSIKVLGVIIVNKRF